ncbi:MAG: hypothetical protein FD123_2122 [Bacteroidetes bacterium]|nr:MAG: hypothetical protein FD123_2122 [Bacteroidota bacterium]
MTVSVRNTNPFVRYLLLTVMAATGISVFVFACIKAVMLPFTHDESLSYLLYVPMPVTDITGYVNTYGLPNNHILNTLLMKFCAGVFGDSTLSLRLPNLIALVAYLYFGFRLLKKTSSSWLLLSGFLLLTSNLFATDFFSLARGYGLANALMLGAIYLLIAYNESPSWKKTVWLFIVCGLMILANFTLLHVALVIAGCYEILRFRKERPVSFRGYMKIMQPALWFFIIMAGVLYEPFRTIIKWQTTFGGNESFWADSVNPLLTDSIYTNNSFTWKPYVAFVVVVLLLVITAVTAMIFLRKKRSWLPLFFVLLIVPVLLFQIQHVLLGTQYPVSRTVQYLYPLFVIALVFAIDVTAEKINWFRFSLLPSALLLAVFFVMHYSTEYIPEWRYDSSNRAVLEDIEQLRKKEPKKIQVGVNWLFEPGLNYERKRKKYAWLQPLYRGSIDSACDYYYVTASDTAGMRARGRMLIRSYALSNTYLYR